MNDYSEKAQANARAIEAEIHSLAGGFFGWNRAPYKEFWAHARKISSMFKERKPLHPDDRERLWDKFGSICEDVKKEQRAKYESRKNTSKLHRTNILEKAESARPHGMIGFLEPDIDEMKLLSRRLKKAGAMLSENKEEMLGEHKQECFALIQDVRRVQDAWWKELKQRRSKRQEEFQSRVRSNLQKNYERHARATDALRRTRDHANELRDKIHSAWNDDFRVRASEWLSEVEEKIRDIEESVQQIEEWIREDEKKLR